MRIATWNVNSVRARHDRLLRFLRARQPDVLCLQELKVTDENFPTLEVSGLGYRWATHGQPTYNGVAILSRKPLEDVQAGFQDGDDDPQARFIAATIDGVRVVSLYVPNGQSVTSDKYPYKKRWLDRLFAWLDKHHTPGDALVLAGDYNIAPDNRDVSRPDKWEGSVLFNPEMRAVYQRLVDWGFTDLWRSHHPESEELSWWDYRGAAFERNQGMRIDFLMATKSVAEKSVASFMDRDERVEVEGYKPSDHVPVVASIDWVHQVQGTLGL